MLWSLLKRLYAITNKEKALCLGENTGWLFDFPISATSVICGIFSRKKNVGVVMNELIKWPPW